MRLWSINPLYLDGIGLVALWRESLLAQKVLLGSTKGYRNQLKETKRYRNHLGETKGYRNHPQLDRFKQCDNPLAKIGEYLHIIHAVASKRGYNFNYDLIKQLPKGLMTSHQVPVSIGQVEYELKLLKHKLATRKHGGTELDILPLDCIPRIPYIWERYCSHLFGVVEGDHTEPWERVRTDILAGE